MQGRWYAMDINPEPWTSPSVSVGRVNGKMVPRVFKSGALATYQESVKDALHTNYPGLEPLAGPVGLEFYFWRQLVTYQGEKRKNRKNRVDATNLQKACEDAVQGVLIDNDRDVVEVASWVVEQAVDTQPLIVIHVKPDPTPPSWTDNAHRQYAPKALEPIDAPTFDVDKFF